MARDPDDESGEGDKWAPSHVGDERTGRHEQSDVQQPLSVDIKRARRSRFPLPQSQELRSVLRLSPSSHVSGTGSADVSPKEAAWAGKRNCHYRNRAQGIGGEYFDTAAFNETFTP